jgi:2-polyprenyl-3-methyl-5-hydroxy-6-metoxy-1,4-benzoquinol methylase
MLYERLTDRIFFCAPGDWTMWRCLKCGGGYLDPRPTEATIGLAYQSYYTHELQQAHPSTFVRRLKLAILNDYLLARFGSSQAQGLPLSRYFLFLLGPAFQRDAACYVRHLPRPEPNCVLLDVGCGSGGFIRLAAGWGWRAHGLEPDRQAIAAARQQGMEVRQGNLPNTGLPTSAYDAVTLRHVIEHLHDPIACMREVARILKPGGLAWIATPNFDAAGHQRFSANWRGLEPPRHLALFTASSLTNLLRGLDFDEIVVRPPLLRDTRWFFTESQRIESGLRQEAKLTSAQEWRLRFTAYLASIRTYFNSSVSEELVVTARKAICK